MVMETSKPRDPELELREYNQKLIELLKQNRRPSKTLDSDPKTVSNKPLSTKPVSAKVSNSKTVLNKLRDTKELSSNPLHSEPKPVLSTTAPIIKNRRNDCSNGLDGSQPVGSSHTARQKLAGVKPDSSMPRDPFEKYSSYKRTDSVRCVGSRPSVRKPIVQGIEIDNSDFLPTRRGIKTEESFRETTEERYDEMITKEYTDTENERFAEYRSYDSDLERDIQKVRSLLEEERASIGKSSTPVETPKSGSPNLTPQGTPKSILRRRKLIDDNIQVRSKYPHTPISHVTPKQGGVAGLNYSYSEVDDEDLANRLDESLHTGLNGSYTEEVEDQKKEPEPAVPNNTPDDSKVTEPKPRPQSKSATELTSKGTPKPSQIPTMKKTKPVKQPTKQLPSNKVFTKVRKEHEKQLNKIDALINKTRMKDSGNDRKNASVVRDLAQRPKAVLFDLEAPEPEDQSVYSTTMNSQSLNNTQSSRNQSLNSTRSSAKAAWQQGKENIPMMGYDWIAGLLDNERSVVNEPEGYFKELSEFRKRNKYDCVGKEHMLLNGTLPPPITPVVQDPKHTCIHGYTVSERLFTQPMNVDEAGRSVCPICLVDRKEPTQIDPGYVRVSIPRSTIASPYRIMPHRRRSFDPEDSYALSNHCLQGWQTAKPSTIPTASTVDIKQGIKDKEILSYEEVQKLADSMSKLGRLMNPDVSQDNSVNLNFSTVTDTINNTRATNGLLDQSHSLRAELQYLERQTGMNRRAEANTTNYPLF